MSRIGNKVIPVPSGVKIQVKEGAVEVQGPKGKMNVRVPAGIRFEQKDGTLIAKRDAEEHRALHGLARALVANAVTGVTTGFKKDLDIVGVGYRAEVKGKNVVLALGYSHPIEFPIPEGIQIAIEKQTHMSVSGADKNQVGQVAANLRALRPPDPVQAKRRANYRRALEEEGRKGRSQDDSLGLEIPTDLEGEHEWLHQFEDYLAKRIAGEFTCARDARCPERPSARACACIARQSTSARRW